MSLSKSKQSLEPKWQGRQSFLYQTTSRNDVPSAPPAGRSANRRTEPVPGRTLGRAFRNGITATERNGRFKLPECAARACLSRLLSGSVPLIHLRIPTSAMKRLSTFQRARLVMRRRCQGPGAVVRQPSHRHNLHQGCLLLYSGCLKFYTRRPRSTQQYSTSQ